MKRRLIAIPFAVGLLAATAVPALAWGDPEIRPLPFDRATCQALIGQGAPFALGGPDPREAACVLVIDPNQIIDPNQ